MLSVTKFITAHLGCRRKNKNRQSSPISPFILTTTKYHNQLDTCYRLVPAC